MLRQPNAFSAEPLDATTAMTHGSGCLCGLSRRGFLAGTAASVAAFGSKASAQAQPQRVDVHHHMLPPKYIQNRLSAGLSPGSSGIANWTPERTLAEMDKNGVATAILSLSQPGLKFDDVEGTRTMLRYCNEYGAELRRDYPGRFGLFATLPLADLRSFAPCIDEDVFAVLSLEGSVDSRNHPGGTAPAQVRAAIVAARDALGGRAE